MTKHTIRHMVIFDLSHPVGSIEAEKFLEDGRKLLSQIPVVNHFEVFRQVSSKNDYTYGFSMDFHSQEDYDAYNVHSIHEDFVENRWKKEVSRFLEIDFSPFE